MKEAGVFE